MEAAVRRRPWVGAGSSAGRGSVEPRPKTHHAAAACERSVAKNVRKGSKSVRTMNESLPHTDSDTTKLLDLDHHITLQGSPTETSAASHLRHGIHQDTVLKGCRQASRQCYSVRA